MNSGGGTTTTNSSPWAGAQPYLLDVMKQGQNLFDSHPQYPGLSPTTQGAISGITNQAQTPNPALQTAQNTVEQFAGGGATNNPALDQMFGRAADKVRDYTDAQFTAGGRGGSVTNQDILGKNISDLAAQMYGSAYETGQNRQLAAAGMAPQIAQAPYFGLDQMLNAGQTQDQSLLGAYNAPWQQLQQYGGAVSGLGGLGGTSSQTAPGQSILPSLLGAGASLGSAFLLSDGRLKRAVSLGVKTAKGIPLYLFAYLWDDTIRVGVMAEEAERIVPDAVMAGRDGFKRVNYAMVN